MDHEVALLLDQPEDLWQPRGGRDHVVLAGHARPSDVEPASHHATALHGHGARSTEHGARSTEHGPIIATLRTTTVSGRPRTGSEGQQPRSCSLPTRHADGPPLPHVAAGDEASPSSDPVLDASARHQRRGYGGRWPPGSSRPPARRRQPRRSPRAARAGACASAPSQWSRRCGGRQSCRCCHARTGRTAGRRSP